MYRDAYKPNTIQISVVQIIMIVLVLIVTLVVPAGLIDKYRAEQNPPMYTQAALAKADQTGGNVAGAATATIGTVHLPVLDVDLTINSQAGVLIIGALLLAGVAIIVTIYLLITPRKHVPK